MNIFKILKKSIYFLPTFLAIVTLLNVVLKKNLSLMSVLILSIVVSVITVVSNIFDYDYYNDIDENDYLESSHYAQIEYHPEKWDYLKKLNNIGSQKTKNIKVTQSELQYIIYFNILKSELNSILTFKHIENKIIIEIKKTPITFLPDKAKNYKILKRLLHDLNDYS